MKNNIILFLFVFLFASCYEDKGNYDYTLINEVTVTNLPADSKFSRPFGGALEIKPELVNSVPGTDLEKDYEYYWIAVYNQVGMKRDTIGRERNLNYIVNLSKGSYLCQYIVKDKMNDIEWKFKFALQVTSDIAEGWIFLEDHNGKAEISALARQSEDGTYRSFQNLLQAAGVPQAALEGPKKICFIDNQIQNGGYAIWFMTDKMSGYLDAREGHVWNSGQTIRNFMLESVGQDYSVDRIVHTGTNNVFTFKDGQLRYSTYANIFLSTDLTESLIPGETERINFAPYVCSGGIMPESALGFDVVGKRFIEITYSAYSLREKTRLPKGYTLHFMQGVDDVYLRLKVFAILEEDGKFWECKIDGTRLEQESLTELAKAPDLVNAQQYAYHQLEQLLYFSTENDLFVYRNGQQEKVSFSVEKEDGNVGEMAIEGKIICLHSEFLQNSHLYDYYKEYNNYLTVTTEKSDGTGMVYFFVPKAGYANELQLKGAYPTDAKVVDVTYQTRNNN